KPGLRQQCRSSAAHTTPASYVFGRVPEQRQGLLSEGHAGRAEQRRGLLSERPLEGGPSRSHRGRAKRTPALRAQSAAAGVAASRSSAGGAPPPAMALRATAATTSAAPASMRMVTGSPS